MKRLLLISLLAACGRAPVVAPSPIPFPDTVYTAGGATPVFIVDSIPSGDPRRLIVGRYEYLERRLLVSRLVTDKTAKRKVVEHERCHIILAESGLQMHFLEAPWLVELICDAFASAAISQLERGKP